MNNIDTEIESLMGKVIIFREFITQRVVIIPNHPRYVELELLRTDLELENIIISDLLQAVNRKEVFRTHNHFNLSKIKIDTIHDVTS